MSATATALFSPRVSSVEEDLAAISSNPGPSIAKVRYTHDGMVDLIVANPMISQNELAAYFGYSPSWISVVLNSDVVQTKLAARRAELIDPMIRATLEEKFKGVVSRSLDLLMEKLDKPANAIPDSLVLKAAELGIKATGMGNQPAAPTQPSGHLADLAGRLISLQRSVRKEDHVEDVQAREIVRGADAANSSQPHAAAPSDGPS
jgi:hypothetical protein